MLAVEAAIAARSGQEEEARRLLREIEKSPHFIPQAVTLVAGAAIRLAEPDAAARLLGRRFLQGFVGVLARIEPDLHPLLDREPFAPRRSPLSLTWPLECAMIDAARHALFREVRIESGLPQGSDILPN